MKKYYFSFILALFGLITVLNAQQLDLTAGIPVDPTVKIDTLSNGLRYYIRQNTMPENRVEMRLVTNAGSILEDDDQQGLAHFVEHMCFNGTKNFSKSALIDFLEQSGVRFGADLNAYTSFDETVYMLQLPTDRQGLIDSAFMVLEDWAHQVSFEPEEIDKERGVIREEWRMGLGADDRMRKEYFPVIFKDSRYADRIPIGLIDIINNAPYERLTTFYKDWYRPNLQAVIVVGDIDIQMVEEKIISHFAHIKNPKNQKERKIFEVQGNKEPLIAIATDPEATENMVQMFYKHPKRETKTIGDYREQLIQQLYSSLIINRLNELRQKPATPFIFAYTYYGGFMGRAMDAYASFAYAKENRIEETIETLVKENERVKRFGFTSTELDRQKKELLKSIENQLKEKDKTPSSRFVSAYTSHFLENSPIPGVENQWLIAQELIPNISLAEINSKAEQWVTNENFVVVVTAPEKEDLVIPDEAGILATISEAKEAGLTAWVDEFKDEPLLATIPPKGKIVQTVKDDKLDITTFELSNGVKVLVKPTDFKNDEILLSAYADGGTSLFEDDKTFAANNISSIISASGIGDFSKAELDKKLSGLNVNLRLSINDISQGFSGSSSPGDFETLLQLIQLHFNPAREDAEAFEAYVSQMENQFKFMRSNPQMVFYDTLYKMATSNSPRFTMIPTDAQLKSLNATEIYSMYNQMFESAKGFTFVFVGNLSPDTLQPYLEKYLASLPASKPAMQWIDRSPKFPEGITDAEVYAGAEHKSMVAIMMKSPFEWSAENRFKLAMMMKVLNIKLRENLREDQGGVYGVSLRQNNSQFPKPEYSININWGTNPEMVDTLTNAVFYEMNRLISEGPKTDDLLKVKETSIRERETNEKQNRFWLNNISFADQNKLPLLTLSEFNERVQALKAEDIQKAAADFLKTDHYLRLVLKPEAMKE